MMRPAEADNCRRAARLAASPGEMRAKTVANGPFAGQTNSAPRYGCNRRDRLAKIGGLNECCRCRSFQEQRRRSEYCYQIENYTLGSPRKRGVKSMKAALQSRLEFNIAFSLSQASLASERLPDRAARWRSPPSEASPAAAKGELVSKKRQSRPTAIQKRKRPSQLRRKQVDERKVRSQRRAHKSSEHPSTDIAKSKTKRRPRHEAAKAAKRDKVRLAMLTLKDSLPETAGQAGPFGETKLDLREAIKRLEKAAKDKTISGVVLDIQNPDIGRGKIEELRGAISRFRASRQESVRHARFGRCRPTTSSPARAMKS